MAFWALSRSKSSILRSVVFGAIHTPSVKAPAFAAAKPIPAGPEMDLPKALCWFGFRAFRDGRPRGPLWRARKLIGKEALFVITGLKRFKSDPEKLDKFIKVHVLRLLKIDMVAVLCELERQEEVKLSIKMFDVIRKQEWYEPDVYLYKDLIISLARSKRMDEVMLLWKQMKEADLFPDSQTYTEIIRGFLNMGSPGDAMNVFEDMKKSPDPPEPLPFRVLLKGLLPHPLLRNKVKQDFEELFPEKHMYDPPEEIFGAC